MLNSGAKLQNYKVLELIGKGGMGAVYKCEDTMLGRVVAIKELNSLLTTDPNFVQRFRQEAQLQAKLMHPNIVSLYSFFEESGQYYMVMEYVEGRTLKDLIHQIGPIPEPRVLKIIEQVLHALDYAHQKHIIHRDIKPSNIIIDEADNVKVMDFGIARIMGESGLTQTGQQLGTVTYMSPEQVKAQKDIDGRSDIYSLGVTLFEMLSGRLPYDLNTESDYEIMDQIVQAKLPDPRQYYPHISEKTVSIMKQMVIKDRDHRFPNCGEIIIALNNNASSIKNNVELVQNDISKEISSHDSNNYETELERRSLDDIKTQTNQIRPWLRYWARLMDVYILAVFMGGIIGIIAPSLLEMNDFLFGVLLLLAYNFAEATMFAMWGTTPIKALLKIKVRNQNGSKLNFSQALSRSFSIWVSGWAMGIPLISLFTLTKSYEKLKKRGKTTWDENGDYIVVHGKVGALRTIAYIVISIIMLVVMAYGG